MLEQAWSRSTDGILAGVCGGIAKRFDMEVSIVRIAFALSLLFGGAGLVLYVILAFALPREDKIAESKKPQLLGVCAYLAYKHHLDVGIVRVFALLIGIVSMGATILAYVVLYFVFPKEAEWSPQEEKVVSE